MTDTLREALADWKFEKAADQTFETYLVQAHNGYTAVVSALDRNPANVLFLLAKKIVAALSSAESAPSLTDERLCKAGQAYFNAISGGKGSAFAADAMRAILNTEKPKP